MLALFWGERGVILEHYIPRGITVTSATYADLIKNPCVLQSSPNDVEFLVQVFCCNMAILGPILPVQLLQQSKICPSSAFHIRRTRQTSHQVIFTSLDHSKGRLEASLSGPRRSAAGGDRVPTLSAKRFFFLHVSMQFRSAGTFVWNAMETT